MAIRNPSVMFMAAKMRRKYVHSRLLLQMDQRMKLGWGLVAEVGVKHHLDGAERGGVSCVFQGAEDRCPIVMGEVQLARGAREDVVIHYPGDFVPEWLGFRRMPDELLMTLIWPF